MVTQIYLASPQQPDVVKKLLTVLFLLVLNDGLDMKEVKMYLDSVTWNSTTTATVTVPIQDCVFHYYCYLIQYEYESSSQTVGCLVTSVFAPLFPVLASYMENGYSVSNNTLLQYCIYYMEESVCDWMD